MVQWWNINPDWVWSPTLPKEQLIIMWSSKVLGKECEVCPIFTAALCTILERSKWPRIPPTDEWMKEVCYPGEQYPTVNREGALTCFQHKRTPRTTWLKQASWAGERACAPLAEVRGSIPSTQVRQLVHKHLKPRFYRIRWRLLASTGTFTHEHTRTHKHKIKNKILKRSRIVSKR